MNNFQKLDYHSLTHKKGAYSSYKIHASPIAVATTISNPAHSIPQTVHHAIEPGRATLARPSLMYPFRSSSLQVIL